jgi:cellulose synthase/poly-beta-1,6-N-acetylglucosamine synthase-like glycosyltransferase
MKFHDLKTDEKFLLLVGASLTILSLFALLFFITLSAVSMVTWSVPRFWNLCFLLCAVSLGGWMLLYTGQLRIGGGVMLRITNILLLYSLILAVVISAVVKFTGQQKYIAILVLGLALTAFYVAAPITSPSMLFGLLRLLKNERIARDSAKS